MIDFCVLGQLGNHLDPKCSCIVGGKDKVIENSLCLTVSKTVAKLKGFGNL